MKQTFTKTIQGHQLDFTRQANSAAYEVLPKNIEHKGVLLLHRDERGMWNVKETKNLPAWFNEVSLYVHIAIEENELDENETKEKKNSVFNDSEYLF